MAIDWTLELRQGETCRATFRLVDATTGEPEDISGSTARLHIRERADASAALLALTTGSGLTIDGSAGTISVLITDEQTAALNFRRAVYDLELEAADGSVRTIAAGGARLAREVTR